MGRYAGPLGKRPSVITWINRRPCSRFTDSQARLGKERIAKVSLERSQFERADHVARSLFHGHGLIHRDFFHYGAGSGSSGVGSLVEGSASGAGATRRGDGAVCDAAGGLDA